MDQLFDRLGNLLRSVFQEDGKNFDPWKGEFVDPDEQAAWEELNEYLHEAAPGGRSASGGAGKTEYTSSHSTYSKPYEASRVPEELRKDYMTLEVAFGAPMEEVKKSYRRLLQIHHPDRHAETADSLKKATEITQRITHSYLRIKKFSQKGHL